MSYACYPHVASTISVCIMTHSDIHIKYQADIKLQHRIATH